MGNCLGEQRKRAHTPPDLVIGVLTFFRTERLAALLPLLVEQADRAVEQQLAGSAQVLVVDNDPLGSARTIVESLGDDRVRYEVESRRGISHARNRVLDVSSNADVLVFIDDDETPQTGWLERLLLTQREHGAHAVAGRVVSEPDDHLHPYVVAGGFLDRAHRRDVPTGARIARAATNNLLLDLSWVRRHRLRFDVDFGLTGGEDSLFTSQMSAAGAILVWCADAVVTDHVPAARMTPAYMLQRSYTMANSSIFVELALRRTRRGRALFRARTAARELARAGQGAALTALGTTTGSPRHRARGHRAWSRSRGALAALLGRRPTHYGPTTGANG